LFTVTVVGVSPRCDLDLDETILRPSWFSMSGGAGTSGKAGQGGGGGGGAKGGNICPPGNMSGSGASGGSGGAGGCGGLPGQGGGPGGASIAVVSLNSSPCVQAGLEGGDRNGAGLGLRPRDRARADIVAGLRSEEEMLEGTLPISSRATLLQIRVNLVETPA
jgi:hypothetical protein